MSATLSTLLAAFLKVGWIALIFNEVRGVILAVPVLYGMYQAGGSWMAIWMFPIASELDRKTFRRPRLTEISTILGPSPGAWMLPSWPSTRRPI